jgi:hypothetical protein
VGCLTTAVVDHQHTPRPRLRRSPEGQLTQTCTCVHTGCQAPAEPPLPCQPLWSPEETLALQEFYPHWVGNGTDLPMTGRCGSFIHGVVYGWTGSVQCIQHGALCFFTPGQHMASVGVCKYVTHRDAHAHAREHTHTHVCNHTVHARSDLPVHRFLCHSDQFFWCCLRMFALPTHRSVFRSGLGKVLSLPRHCKAKEILPQTIH